MKLGIAYNAFDGLELLKYAIISIRSAVDFVCVIRQKTSYHGNSADSIDLELIEESKREGLIDLVVDYEPNLCISPRENETIIRNFGLEQSILNNCTHHISADVDEFYTFDQLKYAKEVINDFDCSVVQSIDYYKRPVYKIVPERRHLISFIHPVRTKYAMNFEFPYAIDITRRPNTFEKCLVLEPDKFILHHMCYVRNNIRKKILNNMNHKNNINRKFCDKFDNYKLGENLCIPPEYINRKTIEVPNIFNIKESNGGISFLGN